MMQTSWLSEPSQITRVHGLEGAIHSEKNSRLEKKITQFGKGKSSEPNLHLLGLLYHFASMNWKFKRSLHSGGSVGCLLRLHRSSKFAKLESGIFHLHALSVNDLDLYKMLMCVLPIFQLNLCKNKPESYENVLKFWLNEHLQTYPPQSLTDETVKRSWFSSESC